jgi:hypothetical protein
VAEGGFVTGAKGRELFLSYGLPVADLKAIWQLSDIDKDERLSHAEFLTAMYLIYRKKQVNRCEIFIFLLNGDCFRATLCLWKCLKN